MKPGNIIDHCAKITTFRVVALRWRHRFRGKVFVAKPQEMILAEIVPRGPGRSPPIRGKASSPACRGVSSGYNRHFLHIANRGTPSWHNSWHTDWAGNGTERQGCRNNSGYYLSQIGSSTVVKCPYLIFLWLLFYDLDTSISLGIYASDR